jgi:hypothetical protein
MRVGAAPGFFAEGSKRYSMSRNNPSGGTKKIVFDCAKGFSLCGRLGWGKWLDLSTNRTQGMEGYRTFLKLRVRAVSINGTTPTGNLTNQQTVVASPSRVNTVGSDGIRTRKNNHAQPRLSSGSI